VKAIVASAYELLLPDNSIDRAFNIAVLAEIPDRRKALLEIKRVLKDDGLLAIAEPLIDLDYLRKNNDWLVQGCRV
jgi:ubiquinone/menaquinone biosynthesis C-methylase UbiE